MSKRPTPLVAFDSDIVCVEEQQRNDPALLINPAASQLSLLDAIHARVTRVHCVLDGFAATDNTDTAKANANHGLAAILDEANQLIYALSSKVDDTPRQHTQGDSDEVTRETVESQAPGDVLAATFAAPPEEPTPEMVDQYKHAAPPARSPKGKKTPKQTADLSDAICILGTRIARAKIILTMLTSGRAREALADDEADELDWMMSDILHSIEAAADALVAEVSP